MMLKIWYLVARVDKATNTIDALDVFSESTPTLIGNYETFVMDHADDRTRFQVAALYRKRDRIRAILNLSKWFEGEVASTPDAEFGGED